MDKKALEHLLAGLKGRSVDITVTKNLFDEAPPLPFNLTKLQTAVFQQFKYPPEQTLSITQSLREKRHLITYNRSTCQYLNDEQFAEAPTVVSAILASLRASIPELDTRRRSAAFDTKKVGECMKRKRYKWKKVIDRSHKGWYNKTCIQKSCFGRYEWIICKDVTNGEVLKLVTRRPC